MIQLRRITLTRAFRTNLFIVILILNQMALSAVWGNIVTTLALPFPLQLIISQFLIFIVPAILFFVITKEEIKTTLTLKPLGLGNALIIIIISIFIQPLMSLLSALTSIFFTNEVSNTLMQINEIPFIFVLISMAVTPAICEEVFFRGIVFSGYKNLKLTKAALMTGFMFGLMHLDAQQFLYAFAMGVIFAYLVYYTKSIFASILAHFVINGTQVLYSRILISNVPDVSMELASQPPTSSEYAILIVSLIFVVIMTIPVLWLAFYILKKINTPKLEYGEILGEEILDYSPIAGYEEKSTNIPFYVIIVLYLIIVILPMIIT